MIKIETLEDELKLEFCKIQDLSTLLLLRNYFKEKIGFYEKRYADRNKYPKEMEMIVKNKCFVEDAIDKKLGEVYMYVKID